MALELTDEQVAGFEEDGFIALERIVDAETVALLRERFDRLFRGQFESGVTPDEVNWQEGSGNPEMTRQICNGWRADRAVARVVTRPDIGRAVARLAGWPGTRVMTDNVLWKPPGARPLGMHQDNAYLAWFAPQELLSCWIALDDTSAEGGTMELVRGSHRWARSTPKGEFHGPTDYRKYMLEAAAAEGVAPEVVPVVVPRGGGAFHHGWTWHGSGFNRAERPRRALVLHAMSSEARFNPAGLGQGTGPIYSRYKKLDSDEMDENYFPVIWREDGHRTPGLDRFVGVPPG